MYHCMGSGHYGYPTIDCKDWNLPQCSYCKQYQNNADMLPHYPVPAIRYEIELFPDRVVLWNNTHWTKGGIYLANVLLD